MIVQVEPKTTTCHSDHPTTIINPTMSLLNRLALANCASTRDTPCAEPCYDCRIESAAVARELAEWLDGRFGYSETANLIRGVLPEVG